MKYLNFRPRLQMEQEKSNSFRFLSLLSVIIGVILAFLKMITRPSNLLAGFVLRRANQQKKGDNWACIYRNCSEPLKLC